MKTPLNTIYLGPCLAMLESLEDNSVDLIVSSPPYNIGKEYERKLDLDVYLGQQLLVLMECLRVLKSAGSLFWQVGSSLMDGITIPLDVPFFQMLCDMGMRPRNRIIWVRQHGLHSTLKFSGRHETVLWFTKTDDYFFDLDPIRVPQKYPTKRYFKGPKKGELSCNPKGKNPGDVWAFQNVKHNHEEQTMHPCQFPEAMIERIMLSTTKIGDVVCDPYMGVGTVAVVARDHGRAFVGAELSPEYHSVALHRLSGQPQEGGSFPNLKTLRDYVEATGLPIENYKFSRQVGKKASPRSSSKIYEEPHHLQILFDNLVDEDPLEESSSDQKIPSLFDYED